MNLDLLRRPLGPRCQRSPMPMLDTTLVVSAARKPMLLVEKISRWSELEKFSGDWDRLAAHFSPASYFVSWDWAKCWWRSYGDSFELFVHLCRDDDGNV